MQPDVIDLTHACEARLMRGDQAGQYLVDLIVSALRRGDEREAAVADRALRIVTNAGTGSRFEQRSLTMESKTSKQQAEAERRREDRRKAQEAQFKGPDRRTEDRRA